VTWSAVGGGGPVVPGYNGFEEQDVVQERHPPRRPENQDVAAMYLERGAGMGQAIHRSWAVAVVALIALLSMVHGSSPRLWCLAALALLAAPSSIVTVPASTWLLDSLDLGSVTLIDVMVGATIGLFGYLQWFVLPSVLRRARRRTTIPSVEGHGGHNNYRTTDEHRATDNDAWVVVFYDDDSECLSLKMLVEGSGIAASLKNYSMSGAGAGRTDVRLLVEQQDNERARPLIDDFERELRRRGGQ
jgi:hypothetical protein